MKLITNSNKTFFTTVVDGKNIFAFELHMLKSIKDKTDTR